MSQFARFGLFWLLCACNVYDERLYRGSGADAGKATATNADGGSATDKSGEKRSEITPDAAMAMDTSASEVAGGCALGQCWWSHTVDGCSTAGAPTRDDRPEIPDTSSSEVGEIFLGWSELRFGMPEPGVSTLDANSSTTRQALGIDVDGLCTQSSTCPDRVEVACKPAARTAAHDGALCRDNSLASILALAQRVKNLGPRYGFLEDTLNCGLHRGTYNMLVRIRQYNGEANDPNVRVDWYVSSGLEQLPDWDCDPEQTDQYKSYPLWRAAAPWIIDASNLNVSPDSSASKALPDSPLYDDQAYVRGGYLVSSLPDGSQLRLAGDGRPYHGLTLPTRKALWMGKLFKGQDNTWQLTDGMTAGRMTTDDVMQAFRYNGFCTGVGQDTLYQSISTYVSESADVLASGDNDADATCDALSFGFGFSAAQITPGKLKQVAAPMECCAPGQTAEECKQRCGDGELNSNEACDTAIPAGKPGACPTECHVDDPCQSLQLTGDGCDKHCVAQPITELKSGDGCCPEGADAGKDSDCTAICGNGIVEDGETCDPESSCGECVTDDPCLRSTPKGSANACTAECVWTAVAACMDGDHCCPQGCSPDNDPECPTQCGDGKVDTEAGETCDPMSDKHCPTSCDDRDACTQDIQTGSAQNCNVRCSHMAITKREAGDGCCPPGANADTDRDCDPICGNGVLEAKESCDDGNTTSGDGCDDKCQRETTSTRCLELVPDMDECGRCVCSQCANQALACYGGDDETANKQCSDVVACARKARCQGADCYCGGDLLACLGAPMGACRREVETASNTTSPTVVSARAADLDYPIGRAGALGECTWNNCAKPCGL